VSCPENTLKHISYYLYSITIYFLEKDVKRYPEKTPKKIIKKRFPKHRMFILADYAVIGLLIFVLISEICRYFIAPKVYAFALPKQQALLTD
jgi:hypothetical protein